MPVRARPPDPDASMNEHAKTGRQAADAPSPARDYSDTLFLPRTEFPMRAGLPQREPEILARWERIELYARLREAAARQNTSPEDVLLKLAEQHLEEVDEAEAHRARVKAAGDYVQRKNAELYERLA